MLCVEALWQHCSSNYTTLHQHTPHSYPPQPTAPLFRSRVPLLFSLSRMGVWGKQERFSCANVSQSAPSNHRAVFSRDRGLRHSLNNLTALCHRALGSQPSKVMTERRWLTSPPIHSHYHLFTVHDSRQTKQKATLGERNHQSCINCVIKQSTTKQWHFQSIPKSVAVPSCAMLWNKHTLCTWSLKPAVRPKRWWTHTHTEKVEKWHTAGTNVRAKTLALYEKVWIKIQIVMGGKKKHPNVLF